MTLYQAYMVLQHHADWREGKKPDMVKPEKLTQALDIVLKYLTNKLTRESYAAV
jgi:hypothetical protein